MNPIPGRCPVCSNAMTVTRLHCGQCGTGVDGVFSLGRLQTLTPEQVQFVETFMRCKGKIKDVETELGISYPTVVSRLNEVVRTMGFEVDEGDLSEVDQYELYEAQVTNPGGHGPAVQPIPAMTGGMHFAPPRPPAPPAPGSRGSQSRLTPEKRQQILDELASGKISAADALQRLNG